MKKWLGLILDILCVIIWTVELIVYCVVDTIVPGLIIASLIITIFSLIQPMIDFSKK